MHVAQDRGMRRDLVNRVNTLRLRNMQVIS
jgi:hypothetical protein